MRPRRSAAFPGLMLLMLVATVSRSIAQGQGSIQTIPMVRDTSASANRAGASAPPRGALPPAGGSPSASGAAPGTTTAGATGAAGGPRELLVQGNALYERGQFDEAARLYQTALAYGIESEILHYNLGNALFRRGRLGPAILEYERARLLAPGDRDIRANLEFARSKATDVTRSPEEGPVAILLRWLRKPDVNGSALAALLAWLAAAALGAVALMRRRARNAPLWILAAVALLLAVPPALVVAVQGAARESDDRAVVMADRVECRSGPGEANPVLFTVHEGTTAHVIDRQAGWSRITLPDGLNGWLPDGAIESVREASSQGPPRRP